MVSPVETIADALIAFILSLLKDPNSVDDFTAAPAATLANNGLQGVCMADVDAVRPVIVDNPRVIHNDNPPPPPPPPGPGGPDDNETVREIIRMVQQFTTVDARSTIVDQSVNQNIWTEGGDVTQLFDQEAIVASGDDSIAAGDDVAVVDSDVDVTMGDVAIGNETNDDSFNQTGVDSDSEEAEASEDAPEGAAAGETSPEDTTADDATPENVATPAAATQAAVDTATDAATAAAQPAAPPPPPADVPEPADLLEGDMASGGGDSYDADASSAALDEQPVDVPLEDD